MHLESIATGNEDIRLSARGSILLQDRVKGFTPPPYEALVRKDVLFVVGSGVREQVLRLTPREKGHRDGRTGGMSTITVDNVANGFGGYSPEHRYRRRRPILGSERRRMFR